MQIKNPYSGRTVEVPAAEAAAWLAMGWVDPQDAQEDAREDGQEGAQEDAREDGQEDAQEDAQEGAQPAPKRRSKTPAAPAAGETGAPAATEKEVQK